MKKKLFIFCLLFFTVFSLQAQENNKSIKIGVIFPLSGFLEKYGKEAFNGIRLAIAEINNRGGVNGFKIELFSKDNHGASALTVRNYRELVLKKVFAVIGPITSMNVAASKPVVADLKTPLISPAATSAYVTRGNRYVSRICFIDSYQAKAASAFALQKLDKRTAVIIYDSENDYSRNLADTFEKEFVKRGGRLLKKLSLAKDESLFQQQLVQVKAFNPGIVFLPTYHFDAAKVLFTAKKLNIKSIFIGGDGWDSEKMLELAKGAYAGHYFITHVSMKDKDLKLSGFAKNYRAVYAENAGIISALSYDSVYFLADALRRTIKVLGKSKIGSFAFKNELTNQINATKNFIGVSGNISLDAHRNAIKPVVFMKTTSKGPQFFTRFTP